MSTSPDGNVLLVQCRDIVDFVETESVQEEVAIKVEI